MTYMIKDLRNADISNKSLPKNNHDRCVMQLGLSGTSKKRVLIGYQLNQSSTRSLRVFSYSMLYVIDIY